MDIKKWKDEKSRSFLKNSFGSFEICFFLFWFSLFVAKQKRNFFVKVHFFYEKVAVSKKRPFFSWKRKMDKKSFSKESIVSQKRWEIWDSSFFCPFFSKQKKDKKSAKKSLSRIVGNSKWYMFFEKSAFSNFKKKLDRFQFSNFEYIRVFFFFLWL